jgi:peptidoglycan/LPS O-acetylase OafA/YrhL
MPQLDAVRGLAILAVVVWHFEPWSSQYVPWGPIGVRMFFVLGAFLVTGSLLRLREQVASGRSGVGPAARRFYSTRYVRIFPVYYLTLFGVLAFGHPTVADWFWWHFFFATNILMCIREMLVAQASHFWYLAAQEQFYLIWPWLVLLTRRRWLPWLIGAVIVAGPLYRVAAVEGGLNGFWYFASPASNLDAVGLGALIAFLRHEKRDDVLARFSVRGTGWIALVLFAIGCVANSDFYYTAIGGVGDSGLSLAFAWLVIGGMRGFKGAGGAVLDWWPLRYTGTVSYGLFLFHQFVPPGLAVALPAIGLGWAAADYPRYALGTVIAFGLAAASWHFFEKPIAEWKRGR